MIKGGNKRSILVATGLYSPEIGGPATYTAILEEELPKLNIGLKVAPFRYVRRFPRIIRHIAYFFYVLFKSIGVDVIYALDPVSVGLPSAFVARLMNKRFVVRIAGDYAWEQGSTRYKITESLDTFSRKNNGYPRFVLFLKRIQKFVTNDAELVIVPSKYLKKIVLNWNVDKDIVKVIYNANDAPKGLASKDVLRNMMHLENKVIMTSGRLVPWKGFKALIEIMPDVIKKNKGTKLLIAGSGVDEQKLQKLISSKKLDEAVVLTGQLDKSTLNNYIKAADVFVLNTFYEGLSHQLLDCMAIGTPIVTTAVGGNPEIIENEKTGFLVAYNNKKELIEKILHVLNADKAVEEVVKNAKKVSLGFNRDKMIFELIQVL
jgi:glycosyltransferase involved in cell wall biosynthesis